MSSSAISKVIGLQQQAKVANLFTHPQSERAVEDIISELGYKLQQTLDTQSLLAIFCTETAHIIPCDSVSYRHEGEGLGHSLGQPKRHHCHYQLQHEGEYLGEFECTRSKRFSSQDIENLERLLSTLVYPLRNALMYHKALRSARLDPLTELGNRNAFEHELSRSVHTAQRYRQHLSMLVIDLDHFKAINDKYGHSAGDLVLREVAKIISDSARNSDTSFRFGGEEFVLLLNNTNVLGARLTAERLRQQIATHDFYFQGKLLPVTASIGVAELTTNSDGDQLFEQADSALYQAKENGRNRVIVAPESLRLTDS